MCPSRLNFQFDSAFMITGIALLMVALFQKRHATRTVGAIRFYAWIGVLNLINALTAFTGTITAATWVFVFTALGTMMVQGSLHLYYHKRWTLSRRTPRRGTLAGAASFRPPLPYWGSPRCMRLLGRTRWQSGGAWRRAGRATPRAW